jgi:integrase/recombinase XerD
MVNSYLMTLTNMKPASRNGIRRMLCTFFNYAKATNYCSENPAKARKPEKEIPPPVRVFTPDQANTLLNNVSAEVRPLIAIGLFAGLRKEEILRLDWAQIDLADGYINLLAENTKKHRRRAVKILPVLDAWIRPYAKRAGPVYPFKGFIPTSHIGKTVLQRCGIESWPPVGLRHSYASYHLKKFGKLDELALEMGHRGTAMIFEHYRELVPGRDADRYWNIMPPLDAPVGKVINMARQMAAVG